MRGTPFTTRDLFWATLVVALALGWWNERRELRTRLNQAETRSAALASGLKTLEGLLDKTNPGWRHQVVPEESRGVSP